MSQTLIFIVCAPGTKWTAPLSTSTPDPCPSGQKFTSATLTALDAADLTRIDQLDHRLSVLEAATSPALMPTSQEIALAFTTAFSTVLLCFLVARGVGTVLNFIRHG